VVSPWDSHRRQPDEWRADDDVSPDEWGTPAPPDIDEQLPVPPTPDRQSDDDWGTPAAESSKTPERTANRNLNSSRGPGRIPVVLAGVALLVASVVFMGLRIVRVSVTSDLDVATTGTEVSTLVTTAPGAPDEPRAPSAVATPPADGQDAAVNWDELARSVVFIDVGGNCGWVGSGTLILDGSYVLTNWHVSGGGECPLQVGLTENSSTPPREFYPAKVVVWDSQIDLAIVRLQDSNGAPLVAPKRQPVAIADVEVRLGESVRLLGYPGLRRDQFRAGKNYTLTLTDGSVSGIEDFGEPYGYNPTDSRTSEYELWGEYIKHTAIQNGGISGGGAFNSSGELVAVPTASYVDREEEEEEIEIELMRSVRFVKVLITKIKNQ